MRHLAVVVALGLSLLLSGSSAYSAATPQPGVVSSLPDLNGTWKEATGEVWKIAGSAPAGRYTITWSGVLTHSGLHGTAQGTFDGTTLTATFKVTEATVKAWGDFAFRYTAPGPNRPAQLSGTLWSTNDIDYVKRAFPKTLTQFGAKPVARPYMVYFKGYGYANNVRDLPDWQLGKNILKGEGTLYLDGRPASGHFSDFFFPKLLGPPGKRYKNLEASLKAVGGVLTESGPTTRVTLRVRIAGSNAPIGCEDGLEGTIVLTDDDTLLGNIQGKTSDRITISGWQGECPSWIQGFRNTDSRRTEPPFGGPGGGSRANVEIKVFRR